MPPAPRGPTIVALGDSTTAGTPGFQSPIEAPPGGRGNTESQYAHWLMQMRPDWRVLNRGVNAERTDQIRARFDRDVRAAQPQALVVIAGVNDIYEGRASADVIRELGALYGLAHAASIPLVTGTIIPFNTATADQNDRMRDVNQWIREYAARASGTVFCDTHAAVASPESPDRLLSSPDNLHPSPEGYRLMARALAPALERALASSVGKT